ncbi:MAG TPA: FUSC family protein [Vicinamibacteria bacterium]
MSPKELLDFLRRELLPLPGRGGATLRITLTCLIMVTLVMMFRMPGSLIAFVLIILITQEDTAATVLASVLGWITVTISLTSAFLALELSVDTPWLRICFIAGFVFVGLFLKRALTVGAMGSAFGVPAALAMMFPDITPPSGEVIVESMLWLWWCATLGFAVNALVQLLLSPGDPLSLLRRELDLRLQAVEHALRRRAGEASADPPTSVSALSIAGMTRPAAFLKTASLLSSWARARHESLAALITLADRLVTAASALEALAPGAVTADEAVRLRRAAEGCRQLRQGLQEWQRPPSGQWVALSPEPASAKGSPLADVERTLDEIALAVPGAGAVPAHRPGLFVPDAFENRDYVRFAVKGTLAALICYLTFIGFDYPEIYTSVITVFVVALSTAGASNQKGILRFGGAAVGAVLALVALVYVLPNVDDIGGFLLVFGAACAVAAWAHAGTPRIAYGGYQVGLAFWKATLQGFGVAMSAQVLRDRLIGIAFGLIVFGLVEHYLWPERAADALRARLSEALRLLADLARAGTHDGKQVTAAEVDSWRRRISMKLADVQELIESSKFEPGVRGLDALQKATGEAQIVSLLLLSAARHPGTPAVDSGLAETLEAEAARLTRDQEPAAPDLQGALAALRSLSPAPFAAVAAS